MSKLARPARTLALAASLIAGFALAGAALRRQAGHRAGLARSAGIGRHPTAHPRGGGDPG